MTSIQDAIAAFQTGAVIYVADDAATEFGDQALSQNQIEALTRKIQRSSSLVLVAVLPDAAAEEAGGADRITDLLYDGADQPATYVGLLPNGYVDVGSVVIGGEAAARLARAARSESDSLFGFIDGFISKVDVHSSGGAALNEPDTGFSGGPALDPRDEGVGGGVGLLVVAGAGAGLWWLLARRRKVKAREDLERQVRQLRPTVEEDITDFGEQLDGAGIDVASPALPELARAEYERALDCYDRAKQRLEQVRHPDEVREVTSALEDGRHALACALARRDRRVPPQRRLPCFFDPRHGPSVQDVLWSPPTGAARETPACAACATRLADGNAPEYRTVLADGEYRPYWDAGPAYGGWAAGHYGSAVPALLWGTMLGSALTPGAAGPAEAVVGGGGESGQSGDDSGGFSGGGFEGGRYSGGEISGGGFDGGGFDGGSW